MNYLLIVIMVFLFVNFISNSVNVETNVRIFRVLL